VSASVNLPLHHKVQKFSFGTGSPGCSRKRGRKTVVVVVVSWDIVYSLVILYFKKIIRFSFLQRKQCEILTDLDKPSLKYADDLIRDMSEMSKREQHL